MAVGFRDSSRMVTRSLQQHNAKGHRNDDRDVTLQQQLLCSDDIPRTRIVNANYKKHLRCYVTTGERVCTVTLKLHTCMWLVKMASYDS